MKKTLLMTDFYLPNPSANGLCIKELVNAFIQDGYMVEILCFGIDEPEVEILGEIKIHRVKAPLFYRLREYVKKQKKYTRYWNLERIVRKIKIIFLMPVYPMCFPLFARKYKKRALEIIREGHIENVLAQYVPFEAAYAGYKIKGKNIHKVLYVVDTFTQGINEKKYKCFGFFSGLWEKRFLKEYDKVLYLENFKKYYQSKEFDSYKDKIEFVGIPFLNVENEEGDICEDNIISEGKNEYSILYSGSWGNDRDPVPFCQALKNLIDDNKISIQLFYCGYRNDLTESLMKEFDFVKNLGYVNQSQLKSLMKSIDFLLNLGNSTNTVPSKLINYIATGKPIIHLYSSQTDPCIHYMDKYQNLYVDNMKIIDIDKLKNFLEKNANRTLDKTIIKEKFVTCSPKYTVDICRRQFEE